MKHLFIIAAALCEVAIVSLTASAAAAHAASVITVWRIPAPKAQDQGVQAAEAGIVALGFLGPQLQALAKHPGAKISLALDPAFVAGLDQAASSQSVLTELAAGQVAAQDPRTAELLDVLSSELVPSSDVAATAAGKRFVAHAAAARRALNGDAVARFSTRDDVDFAGSAILLALASSGYGSDYAALLKKDALTSQDLHAIDLAFARACRDLLEKTQKAASSGALELAALPAYEPIMPLVIDAASRGQKANTVNLGAAADAGFAVEDGMRAVRALSPADGPPGVLSPNGAYDDATGALLQSHRAAYGVFSERVVKANAGGSQQAVADAQTAAYRPYLLETSKTNKLPIFFCSDTASSLLDAAPPTGLPSAMGDRVADIAKYALVASQGEAATAVVLCLNATGAVLRRPDRALMIDHFDAILAGGGAVTATTPKEYLRKNPPTSDTYGYQPGTDAGGFDLWMGARNQASLWNALADARKAAGGDAALEHAAIREALLRAESSSWYIMLGLPQPRYRTEKSLLQFRALIAQIYRAAEKPVPNSIAPVKLEAPAPSPSPVSPASGPTEPAASPMPSGT